jgi:hypothetical protein
MPAVAQISVDFAQRSNLQKGTEQTNTKAVGPLLLSQYTLHNREKTGAGESFGYFDKNYLSYDGGFITAGDRVNYKHSDLQIRGDLDLEKSVFVDTIYSRRKETDTNNYQSARAAFNRGITISARESEANTSFISINSSTTSKTISLNSKFANIANNITIFSDNGNNKIDIGSSNINITGIVKSENSSSTMWVKSMEPNVYNAILSRDYQNTLLTDNYNSVNVRDLINYTKRTRPPIYWNKNENITLLNEYDEQTVIINTTTNISIILPSGLFEGLQVSFVRAGNGNVTFVQGTGASILSSPTLDFKRLAFTNSVATCLLASGNRYFLFGDLLPTT